MEKFIYYIFAPFRLLYKVYYLIVFFIIAIPMYPVFYVLLKSDKYTHFAYKIKRVWAFLMTIFTLTFSKRINADKLPKAPYVICANHTSYLDIVLMFLVIPETFLFLGKAELLKWPVVRIFFRNMDIPIDRTNKMKANKSLELTKQAIEKGYSIAIFPEGLIPCEGTPKMMPFKNGAFVLAVSKQVPIVPITFVNNWKLFSHESDLLGAGSPGLAKTYFHEPISTKGLTANDISELKEKTFKAIDSKLAY